MKQFKDLSKEEKLELIEAQIDGKVVEIYVGGRGWAKPCSDGKIVYYPDVCYRVAETQDQFTNWDILPPEYKWIARDGSEAVYAYTEKPTLDGVNSYWHGKGLSPTGLPKVDELTCYKQGTVDWKDSLIERPEGE